MFVERLVRSRRHAYVRVKSPTLREWRNVLCMIAVGGLTVVVSVGRIWREYRSVRLSVSVVFLLYLISSGLIVYDGLTDEIGHADVALVLGNKVNPNGQPSKALRARLDRALDVFQAGLVSSIIVSGGTGKEGFDEAKVMAAYLINHGVPREKIVEDSQGINTEASAKNTALIMKERGDHSVMVVSQYFHISRAKMALRRSGVNEIYSAHAYMFDLRDLYSIPREVAGYISYYVKA